MVASIIVGAVGRKIILEVSTDITEATTRRIVYTKPDGIKGYWNAEEEGDTSISFTTTQANNVDMSGIWVLKAYIVTPSWTDYGDPVCLLGKNP
jgi:hypothetical protein